MELPLHLAWSGMTSYDMSKARRRMGPYRTVLHEVLRGDLPRYRNLLFQLWPVLRTLVGHPVRTVQEAASPQLAPHTGSHMTDTPELHTRLLTDVVALDSPYLRF